jgi:Protein of unknown function (DUF2950)
VRRPERQLGEEHHEIVANRASWDEGVEMRKAKLFRARDCRWSVAAVAIAAAMGLCGCNNSEKVREAMGPKKFVSPPSAAQAVYNAAKAGDTNAIMAIFGPEGKEYLVSENPEQDKTALQQFANEFDQMHRWAPAENGELVLNVGVESYPFPFPLMQTADGQWAFNSERGLKEIEARKIGDNELTVIDVLNEMADAQVEYYKTAHDDSKVKQYAQRFTSREGKHDGLYWKVAEGEPDSPLGPLAARASAEGYQPGTKEAPEPFHGYFYRILKEQGPHADGGAKSYIVNGNMTGGFAFLAYPAEYRKSGVMTFLIGKDGRVYQKDLGPNTVETAKGIKAFDPDETWTIVE